MKNMKLFITKIVLFTIVCIAFSLMIFDVIYNRFPRVYDDNYMKGFVYQYRHLENSEQLKNNSYDENENHKIIVIGASQMTFGVNGEKLEKLSGLPVYTLGIHGNMGIEYLFDTASEYINEGDIVVFSFYPFMKDDYKYGMDLMFLMFEGENDMLSDFFMSHPFSVAESYGVATYRKLFKNTYNFAHHISGSLPQESIYDARSFDVDTGFLTFPRKECIVDDDVLLEEKTFDYREIDGSCFELTNNFNCFCKNNGANFYMIYSPYYSGMFVSSDEERDEYETKLYEKMDGIFLNHIVENSVTKDFVYDGPRHMNDKGAEFYTENIYRGLVENGAFE